MMGDPSRHNEETAMMNDDLAMRSVERAGKSDDAFRRREAAHAATGEALTAVGALGG